MCYLIQNKWRSKCNNVDNLNSGYWVFVIICVFLHIKHILKYTHIYIWSYMQFLGISSDSHYFYFGIQISFEWSWYKELIISSSHKQMFWWILIRISLFWSYTIASLLQGCISVEKFERLLPYYNSQTFKSICKWCQL